MKRFFVILLAAGLVVFAGVGCKKKTDAIKIGIAGPMTGDQSKMGMDFKNGVTLAVEEWNEKGGVLGKKAEMVIGDDQHDPKQAVSVALIPFFGKLGVCRAGRDHGDAGPVIDVGRGDGAA